MRPGRRRARIGASQFAFHAFVSPDHSVACGGPGTWGKTRVWMVDYPDLKIGATALEHGCPVITRNIPHFTRIPGLRAMEYRLV